MSTTNQESAPEKRETVRLLTADWLITMDSQHGGDAPEGGRSGVVHNGAVAISNNKIVDVGSSDDLVQRFPDSAVEAFPGSVLMPGFINAHTHLAMTMFRGVADDLALEDFLNVLLPMEANLLTRERVTRASRAAIVESHLSGVTTAVDMYFFGDAVLGAARECAGRVLTGPVLLDVPGPDHSDKSWERSIANAASWLDEHPPTEDWKPVLGPHATYTVDQTHLSEISELASDASALVHIHAAETAAEVDLVLNMRGERPVELLDQLGLLRPGTLLAHGVHLTDHEISRIGDSGAAVIHCPVSNMKLGSGVAPVRSLLSSGAIVGLGTDGAASSNDLDLLGALRLAALLQKTVAPEGVDPAAIPADEVLRMATVSGSKALDLEGTLGVLAKEAVADLVAIDLSGVHTQPVHDPCSAVVYGAGRGDVTDVWCRGERVVKDRRHQFVDQDEAARDLARLGDLVLPR